MIHALGGLTIFIIILIGIGFLSMVVKCYRKVDQGKALVRNGIRGTHVTFSGFVALPILERVELIDISLKKVEIDRHGSEGLICKDNMRADIKVAFFVRVNNTKDDVLKVAQSIGCERASHEDTLQVLFESKFSEALKTVGKQFDFVELYTSREQFKDEILKVIGTDLNGFVLDDAAIDFLEQTPIEKLDPDNILDSEGIKRISKMTSEQLIMANKINREKEKVITQQDVEAKEAILELNRQLSETENRNKREVETVKAREEAETKKIQEEERLKAQKAKIAADEEINIAEENKNRQIIVARKNKERTEAVENERIEKDRGLEAVERERTVAIANIEKEKAIEIEKKNIQSVIRDRVMLEKTVVEEQERIKDTQAFASADREKRVAITQAEKAAEETMTLDIKGAEASKKVAELKAEEDLFKVVKAAEAAKQAAERKSEETIITGEAAKRLAELKAEEEQYKVVKASEASKRSAELKSEETVVESEAFMTASEKKSAARKMLAEAEIAEKAASGLADVQVTEARAVAIEKEGTAKAKVQTMKYQAEARGIESKANAMKLLDEVGRDHEEFKLKLDKERDIELAEFQVRKEVASYQSTVLAQALKSARVEIVGGESTFFNQIVGAVSGGKSVDRYVESSKVLSDIKSTFFNADPDYFESQLKRFFGRFHVSPEDVKHLTVSATLTKLLTHAENPDDRGMLHDLMALAERSGMTNRLIGSFTPAAKTQG